MVVDPYSVSVSSHILTVKFGIGHDLKAYKIIPSLKRVCKSTFTDTAIEHQ